MLLAAGNNHALALRADGTVQAWGDNYAGQLGDGTTTSRLTPVPVPGLTDVFTLTAGSSHSLALRTDGSTRAWGYNAYGQLGDGTFTHRLSPVQVPSLTGVASLASSSSAFHSLALRTDGTLRAWGNNAFGQLGNGTAEVLPTPVPVP
jgi:alpha-tubulin suppressor-like RCC1 family protein